MKPDLRIVEKEMKPLTLNQRIVAFREAGKVTRAHTVPYNATYNVAMHCFNALNLLLILHPDPSVNLMKAVLWHDVPERWTGDVPSPAKWASPVLKAELDKLEDKVLEKLEIKEVFDTLSLEEKHWLRAIDLVELMLWALDEINLGNMNTESMAKRVNEALLKEKTTLPMKVKEFLATVNEELITRLPELDEFLEE